MLTDFMDPVITKIEAELRALSDPEIQKTTKRFFKEEIKCHGLTSTTVGAIAKKYWKEVKGREKQEIFRLCEELFESGFIEEAFIVSSWAHMLSDRFEPEDLPVLRHFIETYITNWAECDGFCNNAMGEFMEKYPDQIHELKTWALSKNRWMRRAAAVSLIIPAKHGKFLEDVIEIADLLLTDPDDLVQKGYGWLLKEASRDHTDRVFAYVMRNKRAMPRTALRYAIELMPMDLRAEAMKKDW